ncbi:MAG: HXXEE domain-containing protein, partial [Polyangiaceae bacterium]
MTALVLYDWPYVALALAPLMLIWLALERRPAGGGPRWTDPVFVLPLLWPMYLVHQFEEHGVDLLGRHYAFLGSMCHMLGHDDLAHCPADADFVFAVNVVGCQITFALSFVFRRRRPLLAACAWGVALINGVIHVASGIAFRAYNPGLLTAALFFLPLGAWMLRTAVRSGAIESKQIPRIIAAGIALHAVLIASVFLRQYGWLSHGAFLVLNGVNGFTPVPFGVLGTS